MVRVGRLLVGVALVLGHAGSAVGQILSQRGFADLGVFAFPQEATNDRTQGIADLLVREEVFVKPAGWLRFAAGLDFRANSHDQVEDSWRIDFSDRGALRPRVSVRRLAATITRGALTIDVGKQFIRWGKTDIVNPTDRFAPRDFLNVVDSEFLGITAARTSIRLGSNTLDVVWVPRFTPSRTPLLTQRWTVIEPTPTPIAIREVPPDLPSRSQAGVRWEHVADTLEYSLSFFDGVNHLPDVGVRVGDMTSLPVRVDFQRVFPEIRAYGADMALPGQWFTVKSEAEYVTSPSASSDEYVLYVVQLERQRGEWMFVGGYVGEAVIVQRAIRKFAPDRGLSHSIVGRAAYTLDANRSVAFEGAVRETGDGAYAKAEYSQARGRHWRATVTGVAIMGHSDDFLGQYHRNSHVLMTGRYSF